MNDLDLIKKTVCEYYDFNPELINKKTRLRYIVRKRQICHYFAHQLGRYSLREIGSYFGNKDHVTVIHSCKIIKDLQFKNDKFTNEITDISLRLKSILSVDAGVNFLVYILLSFSHRSKTRKFNSGFKIFR